MQTIPFIEYSLYQMFFIFCFWSFIGWIIEVVDMTYETGAYQNRGFLNMPICPIYGIGVLMILIFFRPFSDTYFLLFVVSTVLCTSFEFFMGWGMEKLFHARWWDYSHMKFNFKGYICLRNSLFFGFGCMIMVHWAEPALENAISSIPVKAGLVIIGIMAVLIAVDTVASVLAVKKLIYKIRRLDEISKLMLKVSQKTGMKLADGTLKVKGNIDKLVDVTSDAAEKASEVKDSVKGKVSEVKDSVKGKVSEVKDSVRDMSSANLEKLRTEYEKLLAEKDASTERLLRAFPTMKLTRYSETLKMIRERFNIKRPFILSRKNNAEESDAIPENIQKDE